MNLDALEQQYGLPAGLLSAVMQVESGGNPNAVSPKGAQGAFQFMPATAAELGIDPLDPTQAAEGAAKYYSQLSNLYKGDLPSMLGAYNWGMGNVSEKGLDAAPQETRDYIQRVTSLMGGAGNDALMGGSDGDTLTPEQAREELARRGASFAAEESNAITPDMALAELERRNATQSPSISLMDSETELPQTIAEQWGQAFFSGYGDEITDPIMAIIGSAKTGIPYGDFLTATRQRSQDRLNAQQEKHPVVSALSQLGGGIALAATGAGALRQLAPNLASRGAAFAAASPYRTSAGLGAISGALYGSGTGNGGAQERAKSALYGGLAGLAAGPAATLAGRTVIEPALRSIGRIATPAAQRGTEALKNLANPQSKAAPSSRPESALTAAESAFMPAIRRESGDIFPKTAGQRTQNPDIQRLENSALAGNLKPEANEAFSEAMRLQNQEFKQFVDDIAGAKDSGRDLNSLVDSVADVVRTQADDAWHRVGDAYKVAREGGGVKIGVKDIQQGLFKGVGSVRREMQADLSQMPQAKRVIQRLAKYSTASKTGRLTAVKLNELENWRTMASTAARNTQGSEKTFLQRAVRQYDDFMERTAANAVDSGDAAAITAFRDAVKERAQYGRLFESNKLVNDLVEGNLSVDDVRKSLVGTGIIRGRTNMSNNLKAIQEAAGEEAPYVMQDLRQAFAHDLLRKSISAHRFAANAPDEIMYSPAKLATQMEALFKDQSAFAKELYGEEVVKKALKAIDELHLISKKQPKVGSSSGSGEVIEGLLKRSGTLSKIPFMNDAVTSIKKTVASNKAMKGLDEFRDVPTFTPQSSLWATMAPVPAAQQLMGNIDRPAPKIPQITIRPGPDYYKGE